MNRPCPACGHTSTVESTCFSVDVVCRNERGQKEPCICVHPDHFGEASREQTQ